jgi:glutamine amidotransferase
MCRFLAYIGDPVLMDDLLFKPRNSLIKQSVKAHESEEPLNGDGFGIGWYVHDLDPEPARFVSVRPAWNDQNLKSMAPKILSPCFFAHVRAASISDVNEYNCHPFKFKEFLFMHNGDINGFQEIKREIRESLSDDLYNMIEGDTDSEHFFALFLTELRKNGNEHHPTALQMAGALDQSIAVVKSLKKKHGNIETDYINAAVTDGLCMTAIRYISDPAEKPLTLYYSEGLAYRCKDGECHMVQHEEKRAVLLVSEKLTSYRSDWKEVPPNSCLLIEKNLDISYKKIGNL